MNSIAWLKKLVSFDTTSRNSNLALIDVIRQWFADHKINSTLTYDESHQKANLFATLAGQNNNTDDGLILSGHTDVVPVDGQEWHSDPFTLIQIENRLYGRGTCDMKGFIAVILALLPELIKIKRQKPLHFAFSFDEEIGCNGAPLLIENMRQQRIKPSACIIGEPSNMLPIVAHKGINGWQCHVHGNAAHSSLVLSGCNAIEYAAEFIHWVRTLANTIRQEGPHDKFYDVPFSSLSTNTIVGGNAINTIPNLCEFLLELRNLPTVDPQQIIAKIKNFAQQNLLPRMQNEFVNAAIEINSVFSVPSFEASEQAAITQLVRKLTRETETHKVAYATEAGLFQQAGIPTIVCGPGSIEQAHRANEFVTIEQLHKCEEFILALVKS